MGWNGVCLVGGGMMTLALIVHFVIYRVKSSPRAPEKQAQGFRGGRPGVIAKQPD
ncbi:hypothetical protein [Caproicibacter sp.]|uniref:hypothetical protein n=1 Tax=Caproicibacter sp. TaxID=2814884 RepID=UPI0039895D51